MSKWRAEYAKWNLKGIPKDDEWRPYRIYDTREEAARHACGLPRKVKEIIMPPILWRVVEVCTPQIICHCLGYTTRGGQWVFCPHQREEPVEWESPHSGWKTPSQCSECAEREEELADEQSTGGAN